jgi:hypothetical protein
MYAARSGSHLRHTYRMVSMNMLLLLLMRIRMSTLLMGNLLKVLRRKASIISTAVHWAMYHRGRLVRDTM